MAELAAGAVSSLLVVIRSEALLLRGVRHDVQFIKEEMESMKSFLTHLARWAPPGGEHDEQVRTWMNQVRLLAQDCNNCIDLYLYRGNPDIHRARGGLRGYLWWASWLLHKLAAKHRAAEQLRRLKERARDVGERRLRYGVEVPAKSGEGQSPPAPGLAGAAPSARTAVRGGHAAGDDDGEEEGDDQLMGAMTTGGHSGGRRAFIEPRTLDDYVKAKLRDWVDGTPTDAGETLSVVLVAPNTYQDLLALIQEYLVFSSDSDLDSHPSVLPVENGYNRFVLVDIPAVHPKFTRLRPKEVLFYILRELRQSTKGRVGKKYLDPLEVHVRRFQIYNQIHSEKKRALALLKVKEKIKKMKIYEKLDKIKSDIQGRLQRGDKLPQLQGEFHQLHLDVLLQLLLQAAVAASQQDQGKNNDMQMLPEWDNSNNNIIVKKLKEHMEEGGGGGGGEIGSQQATWIHLDEAQYAHILWKLFSKGCSSSKPLQAQDRWSDKQVTKTTTADKQATKTTTAELGEDQIKPMIQNAKEGTLQELQKGEYDKSEGTAESGSVPDQNPETVSEKFGQMMEKLKQEFKEQLKIKGLVDEIKRNLEYISDCHCYECPLFILRVDELMDIATWEGTRNALSLLNCSADLMMVTNTNDVHLAREYCYPQREPIAIDYSLAGLYHDTVLQLTSQQKNKDNYNPQIFHDILSECESHEFCMKIFTHALYANPNRSNEELLKLHSTLQALPKSFNSITKVMFKFSYNDLPKEYKSCLLYLAIFSMGHKIRRSTLIGRWIAEGLTSNEDWLSSVRQANRCFDTLIDQCLVEPADVGASGNVKSCVVGDLFHGFITTIARKQHIVETRLSHHLARHFSIFNDLQLRGSDRIDKFFQGLSESSRVSLLKVLDLEGCQCFGKNRQYLKDICSKMLLLKYLSLRRTDITELPSEINNLRELEVLDIRETDVPPHATANILLLKLKRLLAGHIDLNASKFGSSGRVPRRIGKMVNMEVLSNVQAKHSHDLKDIGKLWQLRKLGVVIDDKDSHLRNLLQTISDLHESLRSLTITASVLLATQSEGTPSSAELPDGIGSLLENQPKMLESLSIRGISLNPLFMKGDNKKLAKVTLSSTLLSQDDLKVLAKLPKLRCVRLQHITSTEPMLSFKEGEFRCLKYLLVDGSGLTITFEDEAAPELEKMVLSFTSTGFISGVDSLPKLKELELNNSFSGRLLSSFGSAAQITKLTLRGTLLEQDALQILAKKPNLRFLVLLDKSFGGLQNEITLKDEFSWLNLLVVDCSAITKIVFTSGSAPRLEKIVWSSFTSLSGIHKLPSLKELEFNGGQVPDEVREGIKKHKNKLSLKLVGQKL
ncbi:disease resistance protein PIK6-NP-like [Triticum dicoccoides]|uniref:disease resistance protein PIK6-NP-like n=1 Tax=Triticum dicoccoides TaxID=85692 RepID=UPI000E79A4F8|nr:disease resistance protein PIK6-NP-like [Triticum dicoccoides]